MISGANRKVSNERRWHIIWIYYIIFVPCACLSKWLSYNSTMRSCRVYTSYKLGDMVKNVLHSWCWLFVKIQYLPMFWERKELHLVNDELYWVKKKLRWFDISFPGKTLSENRLLKKSHFIYRWDVKEFLHLRDRYLLGKK